MGHTENYAYDLKRIVRPFENMPFGIVQVSLGDHSKSELKLGEVASVPPEVSAEFRAEVHWTLSLSKLSDWALLVFFYLSYIPIETPLEYLQSGQSDELDEKMREFIGGVASEIGERVSLSLFSDALPDPEISRPRLIRQNANRALYGLMTKSPGVLQVLEPVEIEPNHPSGENGKSKHAVENDTTNLLFIFEPRPGQWLNDTFSNVLNQLQRRLKYRPAFLDNLCPDDDGGLVPKLSYLQPPLQNGNGEACCKGRKRIEKERIDRFERPFVKMPLSWTALIHGDCLASAIVDAFKWETDPANDIFKTAWPAPGDEYPTDWRTRALEDQIPAHPLEKERESQMLDRLKMPNSSNQNERVQLARMIFWSWQSNRWNWGDIAESFESHKNLYKKTSYQRGSDTRRKRGSDTRRICQRLCDGYAEWIGLEKRHGV